MRATRRSATFAPETQSARASLARSPEFRPLNNQLGRLEISRQPQVIAPPRLPCVSSLVRLQQQETVIRVLIVNANARLP